GAALFAGLRLDAKLMQLDMPCCGSDLGRRHSIEQGLARLQDRGQRRVAGDRVAHRLEPALEAAIERVVVPALIVRLMRLANDSGRCGPKGGEAAAAVATAIG